MKKFITVAFCLVACFCLNGCNLLPQAAPSPASSESVAETLATDAPAASEAEQTGPTAAEISDVRHGFFVKSAEGSFLPLVDKMPENNTTINDTIVYTGSFFWCTPEVFDSIPRVKTNESDLVYFQDYSDPFLNSPLVLERLEDKGFTFGITFHQTAVAAAEEATGETTVATETSAAAENLPLLGNIKNPLYLQYATIFPGSSAEQVFAGQLDLDAYVFTKINDDAFKPDSIPFYKTSFYNMLTKNTKTPDLADTFKEKSEDGATGVLENLDAGAPYTLHGFKGTTPVAIELTADVRCLTPVYPYIPLDTLQSYLMPEDLSARFCKVVLPDTLVEGYYILNGTTIFYLENGVTEEEAAAATTAPAA